MYKVTFGSLRSGLANEENSIQIARKLINRGRLSEGLSMLERLVEQGSHEAAIMLAQVAPYSPGDEAENEKETSVYWYEKAALLDEEYANWFIFMLDSDLLPDGEHWVGAEDKLEEFLTKAAVKGDIKAQGKLGKFYYKRPKYDKKKEKAIKWLEKAAENDDPSALIELGRHYYDLYMDEEPNSTLSYASKSRSYYERAHHLGKLESSYVGMLLKGIGGEINILEAEKILIGLAEKEDAEFDQLELAKFYSEAEHLPKDIDKARYWYEKAFSSNGSFSSYIQIEYADFLISHSDQDADMVRAKEIIEGYRKEWDTSALFVLAKMYHTGRGVRKDVLTAAMYYELAAKSNYTENLKKRDEVISMLRGYEVRQVQGLVDHYLVKNPIPEHVQSKMDITLAQLIVNDENASELDKEDAIRTLKRLALAGYFEAVRLLPSSYASMNQTFESVVWQKVALETNPINLSFIGFRKEPEYNFEQQADKLTQEQRQRLEEESKALITLVKKELPA